MADLVTLAEVKIYLKISQTDSAHDERLKFFIEAVSQVVRDYCNNDFQSIARTEYHDGGRPSIFTKHRPIASITKITEDDVELTADDQYRYYAETGELIRVGYSLIKGNAVERWSDGIKNIYIEYTAGQTVNAAIKLGMLEWLAILSGLKTKTYTTNEGVEATVTLTTMPKELMTILDKYYQARL